MGLEIVHGGARDTAGGQEAQPSAGLSALLDLLTDLWADEVLSGRALTDGAPAAHDGGNESGPPRCANTTAAPDPQS